MLQHNIVFANKSVVNAYKLIKSKEYRCLEIYVKLGFRFNTFDINQDLPKDFGFLTDSMIFSLESKNTELFTFKIDELLYENDQGYNALSFAVISDNIEALVYIHEKSNKLSQENIKQENLFHLATKYKAHRSLEYLLNKGSLSDLNKKNIQGFTPLLLASSRNDYISVKLISKIITRNQLLTTNKFGANIIHWLAFNNIKDSHQQEFIGFLKDNNLDQSKYFHNNAININPKDWLTINKSNLSILKLH